MHRKWRKINLSVCSAITKTFKRKFLEGFELIWWWTCKRLIWQSEGGHLGRAEQRKPQLALIYFCDRTLVLGSEVPATFWCIHLDRKLDFCMVSDGFWRSPQGLGIKEHIGWWSAFCSNLLTQRTNYLWKVLDFCLPALLAGSHCITQTGSHSAQLFCLSAKRMRLFHHVLLTKGILAEFVYPIVPLPVPKPKWHTWRSEMNRPWALTSSRTPGLGRMFLHQWCIMRLWSSSIICERDWLAW